MIGWVGGTRIGGLRRPSPLPGAPPPRPARADLSRTDYLGLRRLSPALHWALQSFSAILHSGLRDQPTFRRAQSIALVREIEGGGGVEVKGFGAEDFMEFEGEPTRVEVDGEGTVGQVKEGLWFSGGCAMQHLRNPSQRPVPAPRPSTPTTPHSSSSCLQPPTASYRRWGGCSHTTAQQLKIGI